MKEYFAATPENAHKFADGFVGIAKQINGANLDYSLASLHSVDAILEEMRQDGVPFFMLPDLLYSMGCYVGEVIVRQGGGKWVARADSEFKRNSRNEFIIESAAGLACDPIANVLMRQRFSQREKLHDFAAWYLGKPTPDGDFFARAGFLSYTNLAALSYLSSFHAGTELPGGLPYRDWLKQIRLDYSLDSLKRIDALLEHMHKTEASDPEAFLADQGKQTFLSLLGFYVGETIATAHQKPCLWQSYDEFIAQEPEMAKVWPRQFESSLICSLAEKTQMLPLVAIVVRLFVGPDEKSVWHSASNFLPAHARQ
ncbi:MAG: hypothetical protein LWW81_16270 [Rhodocyclales bacterium]|nr:hypothetical protein [Rhodocyclales bacterium]